MSPGLGIALGLALVVGGTPAPPAEADAPAPAVEGSPAQPESPDHEEIEPPVDEAPPAEESAGEGESPPGSVESSGGSWGEEPAPGSGEAAPGEGESSPASDTHDVPADDFEVERGLAPGGYYGHGEILERPPPDGQSRIVVGSILVPLGILAAVSSGVGVWMTVPQHCVERMAALGAQIDDPSRCRGWFAYNVVNTTYGVLMLASGATILGIGLVQRQRYRTWRARHGMRAFVRPGRRTSMVGLGLRF